MKLAIKIDIDTFRGTRDGVPRLVELLKRHGAGATFLFSLGPDRTGRAIKRVFRPGFFGKVKRTSVLEHYGLKTLLYGTLLPSPYIGRWNGKAMKQARDEGFEVGVHCWDHISWQDKVYDADPQWTEQQMRLAVGQFEDILGEYPRVHGSAGWQMNRHAYRLTQKLGFQYASDTRGAYPFLPVYKGELIACPQLPTTLPTMDELIGLDGVTGQTVAERVLELSRDPLPTGHVYTAHAELEGMRLLPAFEKMLEGWKALGYELVSLKGLYESLDLTALPHNLVGHEEIAGRSGKLAVQARPFLA